MMSAPAWETVMGANAVGGFRAGFMLTGAAIAVVAVLAALLIDPEGDRARFAPADAEPELLGADAALGVEGERARGRLYASEALRRATLESHPYCVIARLVAPRRSMLHHADGRMDRFVAALLATTVFAGSEANSRTASIVPGEKVSPAYNHVTNDFLYSAASLLTFRSEPLPES